MSYEYGITKIQIRRDTSANFSSVNPILMEGEPAIALDTNTLKIGDGITAWTSLSGISGGAGGITQQDLDNAISSIVDTAPETLNTLNELAAAINDNPNFFNEVAYSGGDISQFNNNQNYIVSDNSVAAGSDTINNIVNLSQAEYDAITPSTGVLYVIEDAPDPITSLPSSGNWDVAYSWVASNSGVVVSSGDNISLLNNDANYVESDTAGITGASGVNNIVIISQADYDSIGSGNYDPNTIYFVP